VAGRVIFSVTSRSSAPPEQIFALLRVGSTWPEWSPLGSFALEREGGAGGESVGAVRVFRTGGVKSREEIIEVLPNQRFSYVAHAGLPIRAHRADVDLIPDDGGTTISWREDFVPKVPGTGWVLRSFLRRFIQQCADGLAAAAASKVETSRPEAAD
jgi:hypothetical protein